MIQTGMQTTIEIRDATEDDAPRISTLLTELAQEFIVGDFAEDGRKHQYLFVAKSHHRNGLARRLWSAARAEAIQGRNAAERFTVNASAYAVPAYERLGFRCVGQVQEANGVRFQPMELAAQALEPRTPSSSS
jgi:GNAT superfamily N-acetyltransferase